MLDKCTMKLQLFITPKSGINDKWNSHWSAPLLTDRPMGIGEGDPACQKTAV